MRGKLHVSFIMAKSLQILTFGIIVFSRLSSTKPRLRLFLIHFALEIKGFYQKFQKTETRLCRRKSTDSNDINIFMSLENSCTFLLAKEKTWKCIFSTNSALSQNGTEKQIIPSKTTIRWLSNDIWCYLLIGCFDSKIGVSQQTVVRVYYILEFRHCISCLKRLRTVLLNTLCWIVTKNCC